MSPQVLASRDPATGEIVGEVPVTPVAAIAGVVERARAAQAAWAELGIERRAVLLAAGAKRVAERADPLGRLVTREMGKPLQEAVGEVRLCARGIDEELAQIAAALAPEEVEDARVRSVVYRDPLGVCAAIAPWNFPVLMPHWLVLPALAAGNTVVLKPSEETPLCGQAYADALGEDLPDGVLQVVQGADEQGRTLVEADVDLIAFTGSREVGKKILAAASGSLKRVVLELGGKDPLLVLDDADVDEAARFAARNSFSNAGQVCVSSERIFVSAPLADAFVERLVAATARIKVGAGTEDGVAVGPMVSVRQRDHVLAQIDDAVAKGARVAAGGDGHHGQFVMPTVLVGVDETMSIATEETFGPVACVSVVADDDEAVRRANLGRFGLGAVVFSGDEARAERVGRRLRAGMVGINRTCHGADGTPWVGARESGYGFHHSRAGHRQFAQVRVVTRGRPRGGR